MGRPNALRLVLALLTILVVALFAGSCAKRRPPGRDILLVTIDTTRADRLAVYGCPDVRTPVLDRMARQGALFVDAVADVPVTLPSHTTIMTGVPALGHGVRYNLDFRVGAPAFTLAEQFLELGYQTAAYVSTLILDSGFGLDQGFALYDDNLDPGYVKYDATKFSKQDHWLPKADRRGAATIAGAIAWLQKSAKSPYFLWVHVYDPHFPFDAPPPFSRVNPDPYLAEIEYVDHHLKALVEAAERRSKVAPAIVVTADHGEGLDQHREDAHGIFLYDDTVRVPLIVKAPSTIAPGRLVAPQARSVDIASTITELAGFVEKRIGIGGSLVPAARGDGAPPDSAAYCESIKSRLFYSGSGLRALRTSKVKYIHAPRPELYDLERDPGETHNLLDRGAAPQEAERLLATLGRRMREILERGLVAVEPSNASDATREALQTLGYIGGSNGNAKPGSWEEELRVDTGYDPKDLVDVAMGAREINNGFYEKGEQKLRRFFETTRPPSDDPSVAHLWAVAHTNYAKILMVRGRFLEAANEYARAVEADSTYEEASWCRVMALNLAGEPGLAERVAAVHLTGHRQAWKVRLHRAFALVLLGRRGEAREEFVHVVNGAPPTHDASRGAAAFLRSFGTSGESQALESYLNSQRDAPGDSSSADKSFD